MCVCVCVCVCVCSVSLCMYIIMESWVWFVGGAIEMITTGGAINKDAKKDQSSWYTLLGYVFHLGNTFCMVSKSCVFAE